MQILLKKTQILKLRIDPETKQALMRAAEASHMSASAFALIGIRELLREGETTLILPEHLRLTRSEMERQRQQSMIEMGKLMRERRRLIDNRRKERRR